MIAFIIYYKLNEIIHKKPVAPCLTQSKSLDVTSGCDQARCPSTPSPAWTPTFPAPTTQVHPEIHSSSYSSTLLSSFLRPHSRKPCSREIDGHMGRNPRFKSQPLQGFTAWLSTIPLASLGLPYSSFSRRGRSSPPLLLEHQQDEICVRIYRFLMLQCVGGKKTIWFYGDVSTKP